MGTPNILHSSNYTLTEISNEFYSSLKRSTLNSYKNDIQYFLNFISSSTHLESKLIFQESQSRLNLLALRYKNHLLEKKLAPSTINRRLSAIRSLFNFANYIGATQQSFTVKNEKVTPLKNTKGPGNRIFRLMLVESLKDQNMKSIRDHMILRLLHDLGLRASELININIEHISMQNDDWEIKIKGKGQSEYSSIFIPESSKRVISEWLNINSNPIHGPLCISLSNSSKGRRLSRVGLYEIVKSYGKKVGIKTWPHGLRHLSITNAIIAAHEHNMPLESVLSFSRHKSIETLMIYHDKIENNQGKLAEIISHKFKEV